MERLRACWHGVAYSRDIGTAPHCTDLLGEPLVIWRDSRGTPHAFRDLCIHRGTALSLGSVAGDEIVCAYHGWRYAADGRCTAIPQLEAWSRVAVIPPEVRTEGHVPHYEFGRRGAKSPSKSPLFPTETRERSIRHTRYELPLPYTIVVHMDWGGRERLLYLFVSQPLA